MALPFLASAALPFLKNNWKHILAILVFLGLMYGIVNSITGTIKSSYEKGYAAGHINATVQYMQNQQELLEQYHTLKYDIEGLSKASADSIIINRRALEKTTSIILNKLEGSLTNTDCSPSDTFIGAWNELSKGNTNSATP